MLAPVLYQDHGRSAPVRVVSMMILVSRREAYHASVMRWCYAGGKHQMLCASACGYALTLACIFDDTPAFDTFNGLDDINIAVGITGNTMARPKGDFTPLRQAFTLQG